MMPRGRELGREHVVGLGRTADHRERVLLGDGDGVGLGGLDVVAGARAGVDLDVDRAAVGLEQLVVQVGEALDGLGGRLGVDVGTRVLDGRGGQRVERRVGPVEDDLDRVGGDARRRRAAVVAVERLDARGRVDRLEHDAAGVGVAVRARSRRPRRAARPSAGVIGPERIRSSCDAGRRCAAGRRRRRRRLPRRRRSRRRRRRAPRRPRSARSASAPFMPRWRRACALRPSSWSRRSWSSTAPFVRRLARRVSRLSVHRIG